MFTPWYWLSSLGLRNPCGGGGAKPSGNHASADEDVLDETDAVLGNARDNAHEYPVVIKGMVKVYGALFGCGKGFRAVDGLTVSMKRGEVFALLGHNGAGKTTAINALAGMIGMSGGDAYINGVSVRDSIGSIRHDVSVCPQHDILWPQLTAREHLRFYGHFQGMSRGAVAEQGDRLLRQVHLDKLSRPAGNYSGGMRRRLSMTIAALGNKHIIFLDEPTTGLDPANQRHVWDMINDLKRDRVVILTTHLMEEADTLGDRIGIMSDGRLVALGDALHLKSKFGGNYKVSFATAEDTVDARAAAQDGILAKLPSIQPAFDNLQPDAGAMQFTILNDDLTSAPDVFRWVDSRVKSGELKDFGLAQTSLEDVFLSLDEDHHRGAAAAKATGAVPVAAALAAAGNTGNVPLAAAAATGGSFNMKLEGMGDAQQFNPSFRRQARGLFLKSLVLQKRQRITVACQCIIPLALIGLMAFLQNLLERELSGGGNFGAGDFEYDEDFTNCMFGCMQEMGRSAQDWADGFSGFAPQITYLESLFTDPGDLTPAQLDLIDFFNQRRFSTNDGSPATVEQFIERYPEFSGAFTPAAGEQSLLIDFCISPASSSSSCAAFVGSGSSNFEFDPAFWFGSNLGTRHGVYRRN